LAVSFSSQGCSPVSPRRAHHRHVAIATTKIPTFLKGGLWAMAREARTDYVMLLGSIFLLLV